VMRFRRRFYDLR